MKRRPRALKSADPFEAVCNVGLTLPGVEMATRYDGQTVLKLGGCFLAGMATHHSVEPNTLVVRMSLEERALLLEDAPDTYYITDYYRPYPVVLVRVAQANRDALHDLLSTSRRLTLEKTKGRRTTAVFRP